jgi:predicted RNase H-like HicB family nuclease
MPYIVCVEELEGQWIAHVPDLPGCYSTHADREAAISGVPRAIEAFIETCSEHGLHVSGISPPMIVSEVVRAWNYTVDYEVNAFFASDRPPLIAAELPDYTQLLGMSRQDLLRSVEGLAPEDLQVEFPDERWPIYGVLDHVGRAENWYFDRWGLGLPDNQLPEELFERLEAIRKHTLQTLSSLAERTGVVTVSGETWSARKVMRRTLWHERDHTQHIQKLRLMLS